MPHVVSQMQPREKLQQIHNARRTMQTSISQDNLRPPNISRGQNPNSITPSLSLMVAPHNEWGYTPGQQQGMHFSPEKITPVSAVESVFELSSAMTNDSPNSAVSSLIAELEDTSPGAAKPQNYNMDKKSPLSPTLSLHATTAIGAINDFEAENKQLLERVLAAENAAKILQEQNIDLRRKVNYCMERHMPKTAPSERACPNYGKHNVGYNTPTPLSAFNTIMDHMEAEYLPTSMKKTPTPLPRRKSSFPSQFTVSPQRSEVIPNKFGPNGFIPSRRPPPIPESPDRAYSKAQIYHPDTMRRNDINPGATHCNSRMTRISPAEAKNRAKPLPPLGPMGPSAIPGVVEIGSKPEGAMSKSQLRPKRSLANFFRKVRNEQ